MQPRKVDQLVARQHALRRAEQHHQQAEFAVAQRHGLAALRREAPGVEVQLPAVEAIGANALGASLAHFGAAPAQHRADARQELARAERLGEVVIGAELEAHDAVGFLVAPGEHDDRDLRFVAQSPRERHAVLAAQLEIQHDQVDDLLGQYRLHAAAIGDGRHPQLVLLEIVRDEIAHQRIVVDRQYVGQRRLQRRLGRSGHECLVTDHRWKISQRLLPRLQV